MVFVALYNNRQALRKGLTSSLPGNDPENQTEAAMIKPVRKTSRDRVVVTSPILKVAAWHGIQRTLLAGRVIDTAPRSFPLK